MRRGLHEAMERDALGFPTTRSSTLNDFENLSKQPGPPLGGGQKLRTAKPCTKFAVCLEVASVFRTQA
jgi:hypothetical protein